MNFYKFIAISIILTAALFFAYPAKAGLILNRPLYVGLSQGLVGYWSFNGPDMAGNVAYDRSGSNLNGTLGGSPLPTRKAGRIGQAVDFCCGNGPEIDVAAGAALDNASSYSVWFYPRANEFDVIFDKGAGPGTAIRMGIAAGPLLTVIIEFSGTACNDNGVTSFDLNTWHHAVYTINRTTGECRMYLDGVFDRSLTGSGTLDDSSTALNLGSSGGASTLNGLMDEVRVYNRILTADEIKRLYKIGATLLVNKPSYVGLNNGLVGYWSFNGPDVAGTDPLTAYDRSGQGNNATSTGSARPQRVAGRIGQALTFDANDRYLDGGDNTSLRNLTEFTYTAWINPRGLGNCASDASGTCGDFIGKGGGPVGGVKVFGFNDIGQVGGPENSLKGFAYGPDNPAITANSNTIDFDTWQHVAWTVSESNSRMEIYKNSVLATSSSLGPGSLQADANTEFIIGNDGDFGNDFDGLIDEARVYNRVLTADEIKRLYKIGATMLVNKPSYVGLDNGLVGYWSFNGPDMAGNVAYDRSGNNNNGTLTNGPKRAAGKVGQALEFGGTSAQDNVNVGDINATDGASFLTVSAWVYDRATGGGRVVVSKWAGVADHWVMYVSDNANSEGTDEMKLDPGNNLPGDGAYTTGNIHQFYQWEHWAFVFDGTQTGNANRLKAYFNGVQQTLTFVGSVPATLNDNSNVIRIGTDSDQGAGTFFNGFIDEVRVYNRALSSDEIKRLYNMGK